VDDRGARSTRRNPAKGLLVTQADWCAAILVVVLTALTMFVGLRGSHRVFDVDQLVYERTLKAMRHGTGYYRAMRQALILKEGSPPTQLRSIRPPTMFLLLRPFPPWLWRWLVGLIFASVLTLSWRIGRDRRPLGGPIAVIGVSFWLLAAAPFLYLHAELWGLPFALGGVLAAQHRRWAMAAVLIGVAVMFRELYGVLFVFGFVFAPRRQVWLGVGLVLAGLAAVHASLAASVLSAHGREAPFGNGVRGVHYVLSSLSPFDTPLGLVVGVVSTVGALIALAWAARRGEHRLERMVLAFAVVMIPATVLFGRVYWALCFAPLLACYLPMVPLPEWSTAGLGATRSAARPGSRAVTEP
jgi:hypothetical protein